MKFVGNIIKEKAEQVHGLNAQSSSKEMEELLEFSQILETLRSSHLSETQPNLSMSIDQVFSTLDYLWLILLSNYFRG